MNFVVVSIKEWLVDSTKKLKEAGISSARLDSLILLEDELNLSREWLAAHDNSILNESQLSRLNKNRIRRIQREPLAYIVGTKEFYGCQFSVTPDVLIPRPETEAIIELLLSSKNQLPTTVFDIGTGSGILAITTKLELPSNVVIGTDISTEALNIAKRNAKNVHADVKFIQSDLLSSVPILQSSVLLVNLPYVPTDLITSEEITKEPPQALFSGDDGLNHYKIFWRQIRDRSAKPQCIIVESLEGQHEVMTTLAEAAGYRLEHTKDLAQQFCLA